MFQGEAQHLREYFSDYVKQHPKWSKTTLDVAVRAMRKKGSEGWQLKYGRYEAYDEDVLADEWDYHWHSEPVRLRGGPFDARVLDNMEALSDHMQCECEEQRSLTGEDGWYVLLSDIDLMEQYAAERHFDDYWSSLGESDTEGESEDSDGDMAEVAQQVASGWT
jgi:hypothetical protein